jgi:hypothetical protein
MRPAGRPGARRLLFFDGSAGAAQVLPEGAGRISGALGQVILLGQTGLAFDPPLWILAFQSLQRQHGRALERARMLAAREWPAAVQSLPRTHRRGLWARLQPLRCRHSHHHYPGDKGQGAAEHETRA